MSYLVSVVPGLDPSTNNLLGAAIVLFVRRDRIPETGTGSRILAEPAGLVDTAFEVVLEGVCFF